MAEAKDGINGTIKGKVGNAVFYTMYGKNIIRSRPQLSRRRKPSLKQQAQRQKMALIQELLNPFKDFIKITFAPATTNNAPYHVAKSYNLLHAIAGEYTHQTINWPKVFLSAGSLAQPVNCQVSKEEEGWHFTWSDKHGDQSDTLIVMAFTPEKNWIDYRFTGIPRFKNEYFWDMEHSNHLWHLWVAFRSRDETNISNSLYMGKL